MTLAKATEATAAELTRYETAQGTVELSIQIIKNFVCHDATNEEAYQFIQLCRAHGMNPFAGDCYLIKFGGHAQMIVGKNHFTQRAEQCPEYQGVAAGVLIREVSADDTPIVCEEGSFVPPGFELLGGWARVSRSDQVLPIVARVSLKEYDTKKSLWADKPATMIRKVALVQALREAFPTSFAGLYDEAEANRLGAADPPGLDDPTVVCPWHGKPWKLSEKHNGMKFHVASGMGFCREGVGILDNRGELLQYWPTGLSTTRPEPAEEGELPDAVAEISEVLADRVIESAIVDQLKKDALADRLNEAGEAPADDPVFVEPSEEDQAAQLQSEFDEGVTGGQLEH